MGKNSDSVVYVPSIHHSNSRRGNLLAPALTLLFIIIIPHEDWVGQDVGVDVFMLAPFLDMAHGQKY